MSSSSVGRPVSLPRALAKALLPVPLTPSSRTPRGLTGLPGSKARRQKSLRLARPPRAAKVSWPRCRVSRLFFLSVWAFSSQMHSGRMRVVPGQRQGERAFGFVAGEAGRGVEHPLQVVSLGQVVGAVAGQFAGDPLELLAVGQGRARGPRRASPARRGSAPPAPAPPRRCAAACRRRAG